jgi:hypothetical protein
MQSIGLCRSDIGTDSIDYNLTPLFNEMRIGPLVKRILARKLVTTGWQEPSDKDFFRRSFYEQCFYYGFHKTLGVSKRQFRDWLEGNTVEVEAPPAVDSGDDSITVSASLVSALAAKGFAIIAGTTGTGKTRTIRQCVSALAPKDVTADFNHAFIPVEAGWTDGRHLIG